MVGKESGGVATSINPLASELFISPIIFLQLDCMHCVSSNRSSCTAPTSVSACRLKMGWKKKCISASAAISHRAIFFLAFSGQLWLATGTTRSFVHFHQISCWPITTKTWKLWWAVKPKRRYCFDVMFVFVTLFQRSSFEQLPPVALVREKLSNLGSQLLRLLHWILHSKLFVLHSRPIAMVTKNVAVVYSY